MHRGIAWDKVENPDPQSAPRVLPSFKEYTTSMTYSEEVEETLGNRGKFLGFGEPRPRTLDVSLGDERGLEPPIKPYSPDSFRMKVVEPLTIHTPHSPHVASFHPKDMYCYRPCVDDPKKYYGFKPGLLGHSGSLGVDFSKLGMVKDDWELESVSLNLLSQTRKFGYSTMELRSLIS
ncbi:hypothetical protein Tco_1067916 [Tanacetum coccineum]|uniref:Uncharacterized protein n=1 Tax=Tanacetum coccineum TaxID=301880 RepID=A0ABQ5HE95_9ASTR